MAFLAEKKPRAQLRKHYISVDTVEFKIMCGLGRKRKKGEVDKGEGEIGLYLLSYF